MKIFGGSPKAEHQGQDKPSNIDMVVTIVTGNSEESRSP